MYRLRRTDDVEAVMALHTLCLPGDDWDEGTQHWILWDALWSPVGFCSARLLTGQPGVFLSRAGVLPAARGCGLQRRMIQTRLRWAREVDATFAITYTTYTNFASTMNLLKCGFKFYLPSYKWAGDVNYFIKDL